MKIGFNDIPFNISNHCKSDKKYTTSGKFILFFFPSQNKSKQVLKSIKNFISITTYHLVPEQCYAFTDHKPFSQELSTFNWKREYYYHVTLGQF